MEFDETPRFWYPHVACDAWINFSSRTVKLQPSERQENLPFFSLSLLSLSLYLFSSSFSLPVCFSSYPLNLLFFLFVSPSHFLIFSFSHFSFFSLISLIFPFFHFLFYFFFFLFSFLFPILIASTEWSKSGGNFPLLSSIATCHSHIFFPYFHDLSFPIISSFDTWLNVSHSHKCTTWLMPFFTPLGSMWHPHDHAMCHSTPDASKNVKFRLSRNPMKFDGVT